MKVSCNECVFNLYGESCAMNVEKFTTKRKIKCVYFEKDEKTVPDSKDSSTKQPEKKVWCNDCFWKTPFYAHLPDTPKCGLKNPNWMIPVESCNDFRVNQNTTEKEKRTPVFEVYEDDVAFIRMIK